MYDNSYIERFELGVRIVVEYLLCISMAVYIIKALLRG